VWDIPLSRFSGDYESGKCPNARHQWHPWIVPYKTYQGSLVPLAPPIEDLLKRMHDVVVRFLEFQHQLIRFDLDRFPVLI
jgi:hypothetical protein